MVVEQMVLVFVRWFIAYAMNSIRSRDLKVINVSMFGMFSTLWMSIMADNTNARFDVGQTSAFREPPHSVLSRCNTACTL